MAFDAVWEAIEAVAEILKTVSGTVSAEEEESLFQDVLRDIINRDK